mmetsp:Transcript_145146/g.253323  ORF Transcript_145146/g.253323 Transcript_145146/m.253323 type:complete len:80 (+) Transcript_145146:913-1152(+)
MLHVAQAELERPLLLPEADVAQVVLTFPDADVTQVVLTLKLILQILHREVLPLATVPSRSSCSMALFWELCIAWPDRHD